MGRFTDEMTRLVGERSVKVHGARKGFIRT